MKRMKKVFALLLTMVMVLAMAVPAMAATGTPQNPGKITITSPDDVAKDTVNTYRIYKIFGATVATDGKTAYTVLYDTVPTGFTATNGYVTDAPTSLDDTASALAAYVTAEKIPAADTITITGPKTTGESKELDAGYYYITTTTGTAVIVNANQTTTIKDKNELSKVDKVAGTKFDEGSKKAIQAVGQSQPFAAQITKKHGTGHIEFVDTMTNMTYNNDLVVKIGTNAVATDNYTVTVAENNAGFKLTFKDAYIKSLTDNTVIDLTYSATITSDALQKDPATNKATLNVDNGNKTTTEPVEVYNAKVTVVKVDGDERALTGAGFKLKNSDGSYYRYTAATTDAPAKVEFVANEADATEVMASAGVSGNEAYFVGLPAGVYTLIESTVPAGYNKANDITITVKADSYDEDNLAKASTVVNNVGTALPSTGGIGTTIFYVIGAVCVLGAGVLLVTRRRMASK